MVILFVIQPPRAISRNGEDHRLIRTKCDASDGKGVPTQRVADRVPVAGIVNEYIGVLCRTRFTRGCNQ